MKKILNNKPFSRFEYLLFAIILLVGVSLRLFNFSQLPFLNDELSALSRTNYNTFGNLIKFGVMPDGHPAGVEVFIYFWTKLFGTSEIIVKLPFLLCGIGSLILIYLIARLWFNKNTALFSLSLISVMQYHITYSLIARPYISGLFFSLLMVWFWTKFIFTQKKPYLNISGFVISGALCAYNHYFSLLFLIIVGFSGLFFIKKKKLLLYVLSCISIFILFTPHLSIFFHQLNIGGVGGWLGPPKSDFLFKYFAYLLNYSKIYYFVISAIFVISIINYFFKPHSRNIFRIISLAWFFIPYIIGWLYSVFINPVLQPSVLIFSFPFLIFFIFSYLPKLSKLWLTISLLTIMFIGSTSLIYGREHYKIFYKSGFNESAKAIVNFTKSHNRNDALIIANVFYPFYIDYYFNKYNSPIKCDIYDLSKETIKAKEFDSLISHTDKKYILLANLKHTPFEYISIIEKYFPVLTYYDEGNGYEMYIYSRYTPKSVNIIDRKIKYSYKLNFNDSLQNKKNKGLKINRNQEFSPGFKINTDSLNLNGFEFVYFSASISSDSSNINPLLVFSVENNNKTIYWHSRSSSDFIDTNKKANKIILGIRMTSTKLPQKGAIIKAYVWNNNKNNFYINNLSFQIREGNRYVYSLTHDFNKDGKK